MHELLKWDSDFFGFGVGKMDLSMAIQLDKEEIQSEMGKKGLALLYIFHDQSIPLNAEHKQAFIKSSGAVLVDRKVVYGKSLSTANEVTYPEGINTYHVGEPTEPLYSLALQSGVYSRFRLDKNFPPGSFERMYNLWMENSLNGKIADKVLVAKNDLHEIMGMATLAFKQDSASIGLIAVDEKARGQKQGQKLMLAAEWHSREANKETITVATQLDNKAACAFYEHLGYVKYEVWEVYHLWGR